MTRILTAAVALCMMSGAAMAEPVKMTDKQLEATAGGNALLSVLSGFELLSDFQVAIPTVTGVGLGILGTGTNNQTVNTIQAQNFKLIANSWRKRR